MPYIGKQLVRGQNRELDDISGSFNGSNTVFNLTVAGDSITPGSALQLFISVGGVLQNPNTDFTVAGNQITFTTAPGSGLSFFGILQGDAVDFNTPADGSVTTAKLGSNLTINVADGTAGTPSIQFNGSGTDTGFYSPTTDEIGASVAGGEALRIDSSGRLLVGTPSSRNNSFGNASISQIETTGADAALQITRNSANSAPPIVSLAKSRSGSLAGVTVVSSGDQLGALNFEGADGSALILGAQIKAEVDGTPGANDMPGRLVFSTTADSASSPTERMKVNNLGELFVYDVYNSTSANAANVVVVSSGRIIRSTSSGKYKTDVETLEDSYADALLNCRPVWYRSTCKGDNPAYGWWGFIAEEVAEIDPRLVHWKTTEVTYDENGSAIESPCDPEPEGVAYDRFVPHLLNLIKRQKEQIEAMEARLSALEAN